MTSPEWKLRGQGADGPEESLRNARPGLEDRLFAAGMTGRKAGEVCTVKRGLFVHPEEKIETLSCQGVGRTGGRYALPALPPQMRTLAAPKMERAGQATLATLGLRREADRPRPGVRKPHPV